MSVEINEWLEQYGGISYDFVDELSEITSETAFVDSFGWYNKINLVEDKTVEACEIIDEYADYIPDDLPSANVMKKGFTADILSILVTILNSVKSNLCIELKAITSFGELMKQVSCMRDIIDVLIHDNLSEITDNWFDEYDEENDNILTETLNISKSDISNMQFTVKDIRSTYFDSLDEG